MSISLKKPSRVTELESGELHSRSRLSYHDDPHISGRDISLESTSATSPEGSSNLSGGRRLPLRHRAGHRLPPRVRHVGGMAGRWFRGPDLPRIFTIKPVFARFQQAPLRLLDRFAPKRLHRFCLLCLLHTAWLLAFTLILWRASESARTPGYGAPVKTSCSASLWQADNQCGLNGIDCRPFSNTSMAFRCPANCAAQKTYNILTVGDQSVSYKPYLIGGEVNSTSFYRADSFICQAAIHAGVVTNENGGCGVLKTIDSNSTYPSTTRNGLTSTGFDSYFPSAFTFLPGTSRQCKDQQVPIILVTLFAMAVLCIFTRSPAVLFWSVYVAFFWTVAIVTDPPGLATYPALIESALSRFLPATFCIAVMYHFAIRRSLKNCSAQFEKLVLWLGPMWVGAMNNYTFDRLPIQRLTPKDIRAQPGGLVALIIIVLIILCIGIAQIWSLRLEGRLLRFLSLYAILGASLLLLLAVPDLDLRIHHYILALLFLPITAIQTRLSLVAQGLLTGLFIDGTARWGFDGILQSTSELYSGDSMGTLLPAVVAPVVGRIGSAAHNITFHLGPLPEPDDRGLQYDGYSILVNDVERLRTYADHPSEPELWSNNGTMTWTWSREVADLPEYFRFAYMTGTTVDDYTTGGKWTVDGTWVPMKAGPAN